MKKSDYPAYAEKSAAKSDIFGDCLKAFISGGTICLIGQMLFGLYSLLRLEESTAKTLVSVTLIFFAALFTGIGVFDSIAKHSGAGTLVPITGFANAVVSPAMDTKSEGLVLGLGAKIFTVAGPVILYGVLASVLYGIIYFLVTL